MIERRRYWAWVGSEMTMVSEMENGERWEIDPVTMWAVQPIDGQAETVEIPDAAWLKRYKSDLQELALAGMVLAASCEDTSNNAMLARAVIEELAPRYTTEAGR